MASGTSKISIPKPPLKMCLAAFLEEKLLSSSTLLSNIELASNSLMIR